MTTPNASTISPSPVSLSAPDPDSMATALSCCHTQSSQTPCSASTGGSQSWLVGLSSPTLSTASTTTANSMAAVAPLQGDSYDLQADEGLDNDLLMDAFQLVGEAAVAAEVRLLCSPPSVLPSALSGPQQPPRRQHPLQASSASSGMVRPSYARPAEVTLQSEASLICSPDKGVAEAGCEKDELAGEFTETMNLCIEIHQRCPNRSLDLLRDADQGELAVVLQTIHQLGQMSQAHYHGALAYADRREQFQWTIMHVSVVQAIEIAAGLIEYNLSAHAAIPELHASRREGGGLFDKSLHTSSKRLGDISEGLPTINSITSVHLESVQALMRLDYTLSQFRLFVRARDCLHEKNFRQLDPRIAFSDSDAEGACELTPPTGQVRAWQTTKAPRCRCASLSSARIDQVRSQGWHLIEILRSIW